MQSLSIRCPQCDTRNAQRAGSVSPISFRLVDMTLQQIGWPHLRHCPPSSRFAEMSPALGVKRMGGVNSVGRSRRTGGRFATLRQ